MKLPFDYSAPVLIVDDQEVMVELMMRYMRKMGFEDVDHTSDGVQALEMLHKKPYWVVISDLNMEPLGGLQLLRSVRSERLKTRFVMATGDLNSANVTAAKRLGVDCYLLKPFSRQQLEGRLAELLRSPTR